MRVVAPLPFPVYWEREGRGQRSLLTRGWVRVFEQDIVEFPNAFYSICRTKTELKEALG